MISVIVPVYNAEKYLHRCINSVLEQSHVNFELLLIDDGSLDNSGAICDEYAIKDSRVKVFHKKNGGSNSARRDGFLCSNGRYLVFLDSDDTLADGALDILYNNISMGYDIVKGGIVKTDNGGNMLSYEKFFFSEGEIIGREDIVKKIFIGDVAPYLCGAIYGKELFTEDIFNKSIDANISFGEDWFTNLLISNSVKKILCIKDVVYNYYTNNDSITNSQVVSLEYFNRFNAALGLVGITDIPFLQDMVKVRECNTYIRSFFIPELKFDFNIYKKVHDLLEDNSLNLIIRKKVDTKFLRFMGCFPLYYLYSRLYCLLFYIIKLRGKSRKILK